MYKITDAKMHVQLKTYFDSYEDTYLAKKTHLRPKCFLNTQISFVKIFTFSKYKKWHFSNLNA